MKTTFLIMVLVIAMTWSRSSAQPTDPQGCVNAFKTSSSGCLKSLKHLFGIKKECCVTVRAVSDICWPVIFPSMPYIRFIIKGVCTVKYSLL
ncbi:unnamed protein product [Thlaspi arvense]|uniref:Prolamin-like domain-containing protein n=1 Tax=Thlaspi arvense TaxID=13288 RepID=A0AAU9SF39_THLAR|nr:unnamed protein product [Thlaspi arvense]